jgi:hypothetical protein
MLITPEKRAMETYPFGGFHTSLGSNLCTEAELKSDLSVGSVPSSAMSRKYKGETTDFKRLHKTSRDFTTEVSGAS